MYKRVSKTGFAFFILGLIAIVLPYILSFVLSEYFTEFYHNYSIYISLGMTVLIYYVIGFPLMVLLTKKIPKAPGEKSALTLVKFLKYIAITAGLAMVGMIIGLIPHTLLSNAQGAQSGQTTESLIEILFGANPFIRILVVGILAPIFEELLFRKLLVDRLAAYGETLAIVASGLMFGLFHGNFQQGIFAALIGGFFAYVYLRTRRVIYTIFLHMVVNVSTSAITVSLYQWFLGSLGEEGMKAALLGDSQKLLEMLDGENSIMVMLSSLAVCGWILFLLGVAVTGIVFVIISIVKKQFVVMPVEGEKSKAKQIGVIFISWGMLLFMATCVFKFFEAYTDIDTTIINFIKSIF